jgi:hypothetical protein
MSRLKLSAGRPRSELIAGYAYGSTVLAATPPPPKAPVGGDGKPAPAVSDDNETDKTYVPEPYHEDPDETVICPSCEKHNDTDAVFCDQCGFQLKGADDVKVEPAGEAPAPAKAPAAPAKAPAGPPLTAAVPPPAAAPAKAPTSPVNADGDVEATTVCANPDCGHLASSHLNDDANGMNTGACQMTNCECLGMQVSPQPNTGTGDGGGQNVGGAEPSSGSQELAGPAVADAPMPPGPASTGQAAPNLNAPPEIPGGENTGPAFTIPVLVIEGQPTGDGRQIAAGALSWRIPPLPLMGLATSTHDPEGFDQNDPAVVCGRIDMLSREPGEGDTQIIAAHGTYLSNDDGAYFSDLNEQFGRLAISADIAVSEEEIEIGDVDEDGWPTDMSAILTAGQIMGATVMPGFAAFEGAYIVLGDGQASMPIPIPAAGEAVTASVHFMTYAQCAACDQGLAVITASGAGPARPPKAWFENPNFCAGDGRLVEILDRRGQRPLAGKFACPLTIDDHGRVFGHLAAWDVCHIGKPGCVTAPHSPSDYAYFRRGQHLLSAEGEKVRVGTLTANTGHAGLHASPAAAMAHYDDISFGCADVNCGDDEYGIWVAGAIRPDATEEQIQTLRASSISGDWRQLGGSLELVAALAVPVPGFPQAVVAGGQQQAILASGASVMHRLKHPVLVEPEPGDVALRRALSPLLKLARDSARERMSALRS